MSLMHPDSTPGDGTRAAVHWALISAWLHACGKRLRRRWYEQQIALGCELRGVTRHQFLAEWDQEVRRRGGDVEGMARQGLGPNAHR